MSTARQHVVRAVQHLVVLAPLDRGHKEDEGLAAGRPYRIADFAVRVRDVVAQRNHQRAPWWRSEFVAQPYKVTFRLLRDAQNGFGAPAQLKEVFSESLGNVTHAVVREQHRDQVVAAGDDAKPVLLCQAVEAISVRILPIQTNRNDDVSTFRMKTGRIGGRDGQSHWIGRRLARARGGKASQRAKEIGSCQVKRRRSGKDDVDSVAQRGVGSLFLFWRPFGKDIVSPNTKFEAVRAKERLKLC